MRHARLGARGARAGGLVLGVCAVVDVDQHGQDVADPAGALVVEEGAGADAPQRVGRGRLGRRLAGGDELLLDRGQLGGIADRGQVGALDGFLDGRAGGQRGQEEGGGDEDGATHGRKLLASGEADGLRASCGPTTAAPGPVATAWMIFLDRVFWTVKISPAAALVIALP